MRKPGSIPICLILCLALSSAAWTPWGAIYGSARDERSVGDQASDTEISLSVKKAMADTDPGKALKIHVYCFVGHVFLVGAINDADFQNFAVKTAQGTKNVRSVTKYFVAESQTTANDLKTTAKVRTALIVEGDLSATQIEQEVFNGEVVLLGMVRSTADAQLAIKVARGVEGVRKVTSFLIPSK
ncbi:MULTISPECIES: BON domain-containing protein [unclassified Pseudodesulfovibrio]|uniref:BON domain-containing protein n=1 Tax=unclassified Pseudodesulfovibrio TaxID=2661612 RepID=UPI000FEBAA77|nr:MULTISPECIES: BON domain-containing protein [unclassified Pseudodesulfovibrio]MCJ2162970.1 BON domain-containing protein [Pseudodesulfovibrio sp. S3-i]RWU06968.1 BON domain-containing protein [Pseudodesulfovibrio sp. S3]